MSREHAWAQWMHPLLPYEHDKNYVVTSTADNWSVKGKPVRSGEMKKTVGGRSTSLKIPLVCAACNNGWMSQLEQATKVVLGPMLTNQPVTLSVADQRLLARWYDKTMMIKELWGNKGSAASSIEQRQAVMIGDSADPLTQIWLGTFTPAGGPVRHRHYYDGTRVGYATTRHDAVTLGPVMFYSISGREELANQEMSLDGIQELEPYVTRIWPSTGEPVFWPTKPVNYRQFYLMNEKWHREQELVLYQRQPGAVPELFDWHEWTHFTHTMISMSPVYGIF